MTRETEERKRLTESMEARDEGSAEGKKREGTGRSVKKKIFINAKYPEEKRVAIVEGETLVDFYVEVAAREQLKGNIYKGVVNRIEPGLQAAFVDFGPKKHGFLQIRELMPECYKTPVEDRRARIQDVLAKGQEVVVQVEKDERDTKGASLTTYISLPGRYLVMMPGQERVGISRKIEDREDRDRLKEIFRSLKLPKKMGFILRTAGSDRTGDEFENDLMYLTKLWGKIQRDAKKESAPALIYKEQDFAVRTVRDYLTSDVSEVLVDDPEAHKNIKEFLKKTTPWRKINIKLYKETKPIFSRHNIHEQISKIHERYVYLPSRGYLIIEKTEALTAIDVNSGRSRKEENVEATALKTNIEAADEIARQLRLRDIGGQVVIDFIDMDLAKNRREVENRLRKALSSDKAHSETANISKFGIVEMTRERLRPAYFESINRKCETCGGSGIILTEEMVAISALREIHSRAARGGIRSITCRLPVESLNYLVNVWRKDLAETEKEFEITVSVFADPLLLPGQFRIDVESTEQPLQQPKHPGKQAHPAPKPQGRGERKAEDAGARPEAPVEGREVTRRGEEAAVAEVVAEKEAKPGGAEPSEEGQVRRDKRRRRRPRRRSKAARAKDQEKEAGETAPAAAEAPPEPAAE